MPNRSNSSVSGAFLTRDRGVFAFLFAEVLVVLSLRFAIDIHSDRNPLDSITRHALPAIINLRGQIATIKAQFTYDQPNPVIIKQAGHTLRNITEDAIGSLVAAIVVFVLCFCTLIYARLPRLPRRACAGERSPSDPYSLPRRGLPVTGCIQRYRGRVGYDSAVYSL